MVWIPVIMYKRKSNDRFKQTSRQIRKRSKTVRK